MAKRNGPSIIRAAHGNGKDAVLRAELPPLDELPAANANDTAQGHALALQRGRPFEPGNAAAKNRKPAICRLGASTPDGTDPRMVAALKRAKRYVEKRARELAMANGGYLGIGPSAALAAAGRAMASSTFIYELAMASSDPSLFKESAVLGDKARQAELTAVGLAERERASRSDGPADLTDEYMPRGDAGDE